jgi:hypothetical protein
LYIENDIIDYAMETITRKSLIYKSGLGFYCLNRQRWEPGAAPYADRIAALRYLHDHGLHTYAHIEPYPTPNIIQQDFEALLKSVDFVDSLYFGGWNYSPLAAKYPDHGPQTGLTAIMVDLHEKWWTYSETTLLTDLKNGLTDLKSALTAIFRFKLKQNEMKKGRKTPFFG